MSVRTFDFWSLDQLVVETLGVAYVRTFVRPFVRTQRFFSETAHYFFLKLYSSKRFFDNFHRFGHFSQKLSKMALFGLKWPKMEIFCIFFENYELEFPIFFA